MKECVLLYCRISRDQNGRWEGCEEQEGWGREHAAAVWPGLPILVFMDNDLSAAKDDTRRPEFERLREEIRRRAGAVHLWAAEQSRLERREGPWFELAAELDANGLPEFHTKRDGVVRVRDEVAGIKAVLNAAEVRKLKARVRDTLRARAAKGIPAGGVVFGYARGFTEHGVKTLVIIEEQAEIVLECASRILAGWSLGSIAADLRARGFHGPKPKKVRDAAGRVVSADGAPIREGGAPAYRPSTITEKTVRSWVTNRTVAGIRVHQGEEFGTGNWTPILDEITWRAVCHKLSSTRTVKHSDGDESSISAKLRRTGRRYLLTGGVAICGKCGSPMVAQTKQHAKKLKDGTRKVYRVTPYYLCEEWSCAGVPSEGFEDFVVKSLFDQLDVPNFVAAFTADENAARRDEIDGQIKAIEQSRMELSRMFALPPTDPNKLTMPEWQEARQELGAQEKGLRRDLAAIPQPPIGINISDIRERWTGMTFDEKRDILSIFISRVAVMSAKDLGSNKIDDRRVQIQWNDC